MAEPGARIVFVGHSTILIEMDGVRLLTDPLLRVRLLHLRRVAPVDREGLEGPDAVLISHGHRDHLDIASLRFIGRETRIVVPTGAAGLLRKKGFANVEELSIGEELQIGGVVVRGVPAIHDSKRRPLGIRAVPMGHLVQGSRTVYFPGDTDVFDGMSELGPVDVALLPIWGWGPSLGHGHMGPSEAAEAALLLQARVVVPIHWGTYFPFQSAVRGTPSFLESPPEEFVKRLEAIAPDIDVRLLHPGEATTV